MKTTFLRMFAVAVLLMAVSCNSLSRHEKMELQALKGQGVTVDTPVGTWEKPASAGGAAALNILPGFGNFYLAMGDGADRFHYIYGTLNLLFWPLSAVWGVPEAAMDANTINQRELIRYYKSDPQGKKEAQKAGLKGVSE